jgi:hypothetical protein
MFDAHSGYKSVVAIGAAVLAADNTPAAIDLQSFKGCELILNVGIGGITFSGVNKIEFVVTESDDNVTYTAVNQADIIGATVSGAGIVKSLIAAHPAAAVYRLGYVGDARYIKVLADFSGTHGSGTPIAVTAVLSHPDTGPVPAQI